MKSSSLLSTEQPLARHEDRARHNLQSFPRTDYHFHAPAEDVAAVRDQHATVGSAELRAFRHISRDYMGEGKRSYIIEMMVFALVTGLTAWSLISLLIILAQTARG
jgi:hypothetical protein